MADGWVKLYRKSIENGWLKNHNLWVFWTYCLMKATHKNHTDFMGLTQVKLEPGQFPFGRKKAAEETGLSEQNIRTCVEILKKSKNLTIKSTNKFSIITICNWKIYQVDENNNQPSNQQTTNHIQECKEQKNVKKKDILTDFSLKNPLALKVVKSFLNTLEEDSLYKPKTEDQKLKWLECAQWSIDRLGEHGDEKVIDIIEYFRNYENTENGRFNWADNFKSLLKLKTKNKEDIYYLDYFWEELSNKEILDYGNQKKAVYRAANHS